jgi:hypothetical protein
MRTAGAQSRGAAVDVSDWLRGLGLRQYEDVFRENEIDGSVLPDLTEGDFEKLGVPMGHRKRMLKAIANLSTTETAAQPESPAPSRSTASAERRQLTVMFCDLVGSTAMSARLDPEDMRSIIAAYHRCCATLITGGGGFVAKYMGDGVLAYFGYPQAHEHDAEHAVRAGLAIVEAAPKLETLAGAPLRVRVGIATGIVVVGDLLGRERRRSAVSSAIRPIWPPGCRPSPRPTASSLARARANSSVTCSNSATSARRTSRAWLGRRGRMRPCQRVCERAGSTRFTRAG